MFFLEIFVCSLEWFWELEKSNALIFVLYQLELNSKVQEFEKTVRRINI